MILHERPMRDLFPSLAPRKRHHAARILSPTSARCIPALFSMAASIKQPRD
jgi:hypothetical protein